jgi:U3 small nucleolar RNA-associated protein 21
MSIFTHSAKGALSVPHVNIVTSVGRSWMMWEAGRMGLVFVGTSFDSFIMRRGRGTNG